MIFEGYCLDLWEMWVLRGISVIGLISLYFLLFDYRVFMLNINPYKNTVLSLKNNKLFYTKLCYKIILVIFINFKIVEPVICTVTLIFFGYLLYIQKISLIYFNQLLCKFMQCLDSLIFHVTFIAIIGQIFAFKYDHLTLIPLSLLLFTYYYSIFTFKRNYNNFLEKEELKCNENLVENLIFDLIRACKNL